MPRLIEQVVGTDRVRYVLYHTDGCHLCELAAELLQQANISYRHVDICDDELLAEKYGIRIPVVSDTQTNKELGWPFDMDSLQEFTGDLV
ncbi:MAG: glutaredoxin family protein [Parashewanella sp.]